MSASSTKWRLLESSGEIIIINFELLSLLLIPIDLSNLFVHDYKMSSCRHSKINRTIIISKFRSKIVREQNTYERYGGKPWWIECNPESGPGLINANQEIHTDINDHFSPTASRIVCPARQMRQPSRPRRWAPIEISARVQTAPLWQRDRGCSSFFSFLSFLFSPWLIRVR